MTSVLPSSLVQAVATRMKAPNVMRNAAEVARSLGAPEVLRDPHVQTLVSDLDKVIRLLVSVPPAVVVYGTARSKPGDPNYEFPRQVGEQIAKLQFDVGRRGKLPGSVRTGAGPGAMDAAPRGFREAMAEVASGVASTLVTSTRVDGVFIRRGEDKRSQGVKIDLSNNGNFEQEISKYLQIYEVADDFLFRKLGLMLNALAHVGVGGGMGTLEEILEVLVLKSRGAHSDLVMVGPSSFYGDIVETLGLREKVTMIEAPEDVASALAHKQLTGWDAEPRAVVSSFLRDLLDGLSKVSKLPPAVTFVGSPKVKPGSAQAAMLEQISEGLTKAGVPLRTSSGGQVSAAVAAGAHRADPAAQVQAFAMRGEAEGMGEVKVHREFENFPLLKKVLTTRCQALVFSEPDLETLSVLFSIVTLLQTKEIAPIELVLLGREKWQPLWNQVCDVFIAQGTISPGDRDLVRFVDDPQEAIAALRT